MRKTFDRMGRDMAGAKWSERSTWLALSVVAALAVFIFVTGWTDPFVIDAELAAPFLITFGIAAVVWLAAVACWIRALVLHEGRAVLFAFVAGLAAAFALSWMAVWALGAIVSLSVGG